MKSEKAISARLEDRGYVSFVPERPEPADLGKDYSGNGNRADLRTGHILLGGAKHPTIPTKGSE